MQEIGSFRVGDAVEFPGVVVPDFVAQFFGFYRLTVESGWLLRKLPRGWVVVYPLDDGQLLLLLVRAADLRRVSRFDLSSVDGHELSYLWRVVDFMHDTSAWLPGLCSIMGGFDELGTKSA